MPKPWPVWKTDEEAEHFVATSDLTEYDLSALRRVRFVFTPDKGVAVVDAVTGVPIYPVADEAALRSAAATAGKPPSAQDSTARSEDPRKALAKR